MKTRNRIIVGFLAASSLALAVPFVAHANPFGGDGPRACATEDGRGGPMGHRGHRHGGMQGERMGMSGDDMGMRGMHHMLRGLDLSDEQRDKIFELRHAQAPEMRAKWKEARASREALRALAFSADYSDARAAELSAQAGQAMADIAAMRTRLQAGIYAVLTEPQREALKARKGMPRAAGEAGLG